MATGREEDRKGEHAINKLDMLGLPKQYAHLEEQINQTGRRISEIDQDIAKARRAESYRPEPTGPDGRTGEGTGSADRSIQSLTEEKAQLRHGIKQTMAAEMDGMDPATRTKAVEMLSDKTSISPKEAHAAWQQHRQGMNAKKLDHSQQKMLDMLGPGDEGGGGSASAGKGNTAPDNPDKDPDPSSPSPAAPAGQPAGKQDYSQSHPLTSRYMEQFKTNKTDVAPEPSKEKSMDEGIDRDER